MTAPETAPSMLDRCIVCREQYCDAWTDDDEPIHKSCAREAGEVLR